MTSSPEQLRQDIEKTRGELTSDVAALTNKVSPKRVVGQRVNRVRSTWRSVKGKVMGTASEMGEASGSTASSAAHQVSSAASSAGNVARSAGQVPREQVQGSPLAAGIIAFGVGMLVSSLLPPSQKERQATGLVKGEASQRAGEIKQQVRDAAQHVGKDLGPPARQAVMESAKSATHGASAVMDQSRSAAQDVRAQAREAKENVKSP